MITVLVLTFNRPEAVKLSLEALSASIRKSSQTHAIHLIDDGSEVENYEKIKKICADFFDKNCVTFHRSRENLGYNANLIRAIKLAKTLTANEHNILYIHESDMIVSSNWISKLMELLTKYPDLVVTPVHLKDHLSPQYQRKLVNEAIKPKGLYLSKRKFSSPIKNYTRKIQECYGTIGTLAFKQKFLDQLAANENMLSELKGGEDALISYLANENLVCTFPGQSRIHPSLGLHGDMSSNVASFEKFMFFNLLVIFIKKNSSHLFKEFKGVLKL